MYIISLNTGSSSIKLSIFETKKLTLIDTVQLENVTNFEKSLQKTLGNLKEVDLSKVTAVAHRFVHGGEEFKQTTLITPKIIAKLEKLKHLAPLHNPNNLKGIIVAKKLIKAPHFAVFDTSFHQTLKPKAYLYGIPYKYYVDKKIRKYGFHGINHKYVYETACEQLGLAKNQANGIVCHLGNGCSVSAISNGRSVDTSMGFTPLEGLIMGTRSGNIDPAIIFFLKREYPRLDVEKMLLEKSGILGLSQLSNHMRTVYLAAKKGHKVAQMAIDTFCYRVSHYLGFYANLLENVDFIAFTGGMGEQAGYIRKKVLNNLPGLKIDQSKILVITANEALEMAKEVKSCLSK